MNNSGTLGYAVGANGTIVVYDGAGSWATEPSGVAKTLNGVFGFAPSPTWAVGDSGTILRRN
jgi:hypothetical protein